MTECFFFYLKHTFIAKKYTSSEILSFLHHWVLMKVWIWYRCQNGKENYYHHDGERLGFYKKSTCQNSEQKKDVLVMFTFKKRMSSNLFDKNCTQENIQFHNQHWESWLIRGIVIEQVITSNPLIFPVKNFARTISKTLPKE